MTYEENPQYFNPGAGDYKYLIPRVVNIFQNSAYICLINNIMNMENWYIKGNILVTTSENVDINSLCVYYTGDFVNPYKIIEGDLIIDNDQFKDRVFVNMFATGDFIFYSNNKIRILGVLNRFTLTNELDGINIILNGINTWTAQKLKLMGYFSNLELFLMEFLRMIVFNSKSNMEQFISSIDNLKINNNIKQRIRNDLSNKTTNFDRAEVIYSYIPQLTIYHRFDDVKNILKVIYDIEMPDYSDIKQDFMNYRHDLTHRSGRDFFNTVKHIDRNVVNDIYKHLIEYEDKLKALVKQLGYII
ncbi:hypothetical protein [Phocaeicola coprophilus]|uniref:hypothetical protein n=1 Tax=Phocaeicola coprophilus TaxID=387090 RepID=UPI0011C2376B|nr:hypothetical protein [Phocaeicola coprophilus]